MLDDAPEMAEDEDIVVKTILHFGSHGFAPFLSGLFAGANVVELLADIVDSSANTGKFVFIGVLVSRLFRNLYMEYQMFERIAIDKPILFLILKRIPRGILIIAEHDCLIFIDMMTEETFGSTGNQLVLDGAFSVSEIVVLCGAVFFQKKFDNFVVGHGKHFLIKRPCILRFYDGFDIGDFIRRKMILAV